MNLSTKLNDWSLIAVAHAQADSTNNKNNIFDLFNGFGLAQGGDVEGAKGLLVNIINWILVLAGLIAFIFLILQGIKYITSGGDAGKATEARNGIINAIIGIVVIVLALFIVRFAFDLGQQLPETGGLGG